VSKTKAWAITVLVILGSVTLILAPFSLMRMKVDVSTRSLLPEKTHAVDALNKMESVFGSENTILVIMKSRIGNVLTSVEALSELRRLIGIFRKLKGVVRVESIFDAARLKMKGLRLQEEKYLDSPNPVKLLEDGFYAGNLVNETGDVLAVNITVDPTHSTEIVRKLKSVESTLFEIHLIGDPVVETEIASSVWLIAIIYPPILFGLIWFLYFLRLGNVGAAAIPPILSITATIWVYEIAAMLGIPLNVLTATVGAFIIVVSSTYGLHFIDRYMEHRKEHDFMESIKLTLKEESRPIFLSALTTAVAFLSFLFTPLKAFKYLGMLVALGVMVSCFMTLVVIPALGALFNIHRRGHHVVKMRASAIKWRWRKWAFIAIMVMVAFSPLLLKDLQVNSDDFAYFKKDSELRRSLDVMLEHFGWVTPIYFVIEKDKPFTVSDQRRLLELIEKFEKIDGVAGTVSALDFYRNYGVPLPMISVFARMNRGLSYFVKGNTLRIMLKTCIHDAQGVETLAEKLKQLVPEDFTYRWYIASPVLITASLNKEVVRSQVITIVFSLLFIFLLLLVIFRSIKLSFMATIPVGLTVLFNLIFMALTKIWLEISTSIIGGMLTGLVIDYAIHLVDGCMRMGKSIEHAFVRVAPAIVSNASGLAMGFLTLVFAPMLLYARIGCLLVVGISFGVFATLTFIPLLFRWFHTTLPQTS